MIGQEDGAGRVDGAAAAAVVAGGGRRSSGPPDRRAHGVDLAGRRGGAAPAFASPALGGAQSVMDQLALELVLEFAGGGGVRTVNSTVDSDPPVRGWRAVRSAAEHAPSWMRRARRSRRRTSGISRMWPVPRAGRGMRRCGRCRRAVRGRGARNLGRCKGGGAAVLPEDGRALNPGLVRDGVLPGGGLLAGRDPLAYRVRRRGPLPYGEPAPVRRRTLSVVTTGADGTDDAPRSRNVRVHWTHRLPVAKRSSAHRSDTA